MSQHTNTPKDRVADIIYGCVHPDRDEDEAAAMSQFAYEEGRLGKQPTYPHDLDYMASYTCGREEIAEL